MIWRIRSREISCNHRTLIMGILNITPDSFSDGGRFMKPDEALLRALQMEKEGADFLDIGAESTRPGASPVSSEDELDRLLPVLEALHLKIKIPISIDTTKAKVAEVCLQRGAKIINDVSGLGVSGKKMAEVVRDFEAGLILMHRRGMPGDMQSFAHYADVVEEVLAELRQSMELAFQCGVEAEQLVVDPGLGFSKDAEQNFILLAGIERFHELKRPVLLGPSRKSFLGKVTGRPVEDREYATAAAAVYAVMKQVQILRVHEVGAIRDAVSTAEAIREANGVRA